MPRIPDDPAKMRADAESAAESLLYLLEGYRARVQSGLNADIFRIGLLDIIVSMRRTPGLPEILEIPDEHFQVVEDGGEIPPSMLARLISKVRDVLVGPN